MNKLKKNADATVQKKRNNSGLAIAVNRMVAAAELFGDDRAELVMQNENVPQEIAVRVLKSKSTRRSSDWK